MTSYREQVTEARRPATSQPKFSVSFTLSSATEVAISSKGIATSSKDAIRFQLPPSHLVAEAVGAAECFGESEGSQRAASCALERCGV